MSASQHTELLSIKDAEQAYPFGHGMLYRADYRKKIGLPAVRIGRRLWFRREDLESVIAQSVGNASIK